MSKPTPMTASPKYAIGNILENDNGCFGRVFSVAASLFWATDGSTVSKISYRVKDGNGYFDMAEADVKRVVAEE